MSSSCTWNSARRASTAAWCARAEADLVFRFDVQGAPAPHDIHFACDWTLPVPPLAGFFAQAPQLLTTEASNPDAGSGWVWTAPGLAATTVVPLSFGSRQGAGAGAFSTVGGGDYRFVIPLELVAFDLGPQTLAADLTLCLAFADQALAAIGAVPEPATGMLWLAGAVAVSACAGRRRGA